MVRRHFRSSLAGFQIAAGLILLGMLAGPALAGWFDNAWGFRRQLDVEWAADKAGGEELAEAEIYTAGKHKADGSDIRVATDDGRLVASHVQRVGPGDKVRVIFALARDQKRYWVYFGNDKPAAPPKGLEDVTYRCGLQLDMHQWTGGVVNNFQQMLDSWDRSPQVIGRKLITRLESGINPFGDQMQTISRISGSLTVPLDGTYTFAGSAQNRGALYLDGMQVLWVEPSGDARFSAKVELKRGKHDLLFYHVNPGGDGRFVIVWQRPDTNKLDVISADALGIPGRVLVGAMEEDRKTITADFKVEYLGESFFANHYAHRYRFTGFPPKAGTGPKFDWDFGDGQTASGPSVEHVFLTDGAYPIRVTVHVGSNTDTQTNHLAVSRFYERIDNPPTDLPALHARLVAGYDLPRLSPASLPWALELMLRGDQWDTAAAIASQLAITKDADPGMAMMALTDATRELLAHDRAAAVLKVWQSVPADSRLQPAASRQLAQLLLWRVADFAQAVSVLEPLAKTRPTDRDLRRLYGQALVLAGRGAEGRKVLEALPPEGPPDRQAAMSGAMARSVEYYLSDREKDWETGEQTWDKWQSQYPAEFLEGYSVVLRVKLMLLHSPPEAAAKVAEAFALAVPQSSYAPELLDRASKLLAKSDPARSQSLRQLLKQKYPEDPLSQDGGK